MANKKKNKGVAPVDNPMKMFKFRQKLDKNKIFRFCLRLSFIKDKIITVFKGSHYSQNITAKKISTKFFILKHIFIRSHFRSNHFMRQTKRRAWAEEEQNAESEKSNSKK